MSKVQKTITQITAMVAMGAVTVLGAAVAEDRGADAEGIEVAGHAPGRSTIATAVIRGCTDPDIEGFAFLRERPSDEGVKEINVTLAVSGLPNGKHAVHIHQTATCEPCGAAGGHFDPGPNSNTNPDGNHPFHSGDLVNLDVRHHFGVLHASTTRVTLSPGPLSVNDEDGSAFIIHVDPDSYCPDGPTAGCAGGARAACGIIEVRQ